jgi:hypothetical protein
MNVLLLGLVGLAAAAVLWLAYELVRLRQRTDSLPLGDEELYGLVGRVTDSMQLVQETLERYDRRLGALEGRISRAIQRVGVVNYDAFGDIAGGLSRSIALLDQEGNGVVISQLIGRTDSRLYVKGVASGSGEEPLSPEETAAVEQALQA